MSIWRWMRTQTRKAMKSANQPRSCEKRNGPEKRESGPRSSARAPAGKRGTQPVSGPLVLHRHGSVQSDFRFWASCATTARMKPNPDAEYLTTVEVAELLRIHRSTIYKLLRQGQTPFLKIGSDYRFRKSSIEKWIADRQLN